MWQTAVSFVFNFVSLLSSDTAVMVWSANISENLDVSITFDDGDITISALYYYPRSAIIHCESWKKCCYLYLS